MRKNIVIGVLISAILIGVALTVHYNLVAPETPIITDPEDLADGPRILNADFWSDFYPDQYSSYLLNSEMEETPFGGSVPYSYVERYLDLQVLYAGNAFSLDYLRSRGHVYSLEDVIGTERGKPGASCLSCKTPDYLDMIEEHGFDVHAMDFYQLADKAQNPISCYDCHGNTPGEIKITRDHLSKALELVDDDYKMGDLVCAQCHVEYYLHPETKEVILPWDYGITVEGMERTFEEADYFDWIHPDTGTELLKVQHPEFETFQGSVHSDFGMSCLDCHMPRKQNEAGEVYHSHHWTSPLKHIEESCLSCHAETPDELTDKVLSIQSSVYDMTNEVSALIVELVKELTAAVDSGEVSEEILNQVREYHRKAQWRWDFVFVENSTGFHHSDFARNTLDDARSYAEKGLELLR